MFSFQRLKFKAGIDLLNCFFGKDQKLKRNKISFFTSKIQSYTNNVLTFWIRTKRPPTTQPPPRITTSAEISKDETSENETSQNETSENEIRENEVSESEITSEHETSENETSENETSENETSENDDNETYPEREADEITEEVLAKHKEVGEF
jgi:hypothetical protein